MLNCAEHAERQAKSRCTRCERALCEACERTLLDKPYCAACAAEVERRLEARRAATAGEIAAEVPPGALPGAPPAIAPGAAPGLGRPLLFALAAGVGGAFVWFLSVVLTDYKLGLVAVGVGWLVGFAAVQGAGGTGGTQLAALSLVVAVVSMLFGEYLIVNHVVSTQLGGTGLLGAGAFFAIYPQTVGVLDLVFYALGAYEAWKLPASAAGATAAA